MVSWRETRCEGRSGGPTGVEAGLIFFLLDPQEFPFLAAFEEEWSDT